MTTAIVGAGAIGGLLGARLARAGDDDVLIARGAHLDAMRSRGLTLRSAEGEFTVRPEATSDMRAISRASQVFITLKAHGIPPVAESIGAALAPDACVVAAVNGIPWWYFPDRHLETVDPGGVIARSIPRDRVVGCVVYPAATLVEPGVILHEEGNRFSVGEPDGAKTERVERIGRLLAGAGFKAPVQSRLVPELWLKLVGNATLNPLSVIARATIAQMLAADAGRTVVRQLMLEVAAVARSVDVDLPLSIDKRIEGAAGVGEHRTSMLQDLEAGKPLELDALLGAVVEIADWKGVDVPGLRTVYMRAKMVEATAPRAG